jgi:UDP:flavonoid glycosyltransferase YjiC (YdhE family)
LVTQGTIANRDFSELVRPAIDALADLNVLVVVTTGGQSVDQLGPLPSNVRATEYLPYDKLFPLLDVMVTNGGYGGVHYALAHSIPLVVAGGGEDKPEVAARIAWSGVGVNLHGGRPKPKAIRRAVRQVLDHSRYRVAAGLAAEQIAAAPGVGGLAKLITDLAQHR